MLESLPELALSTLCASLCPLSLLSLLATASTLRLAVRALLPHILTRRIDALRVPLPPLERREPVERGDGSSRRCGGIALREGEGGSTGGGAEDDLREGERATVGGLGAALGQGEQGSAREEAARNEPLGQEEVGGANAAGDGAARAVLQLLLAEEVALWLRARPAAEFPVALSTLFHDHQGGDVVLRWVWRPPATFAPLRRGELDGAALGPLDAFRRSLRYHAPLHVMLAVLGGATNLDQTHGMSLLSSISSVLKDVLCAEIDQSNSDGGPGSCPPSGRVASAMLEWGVLPRLLRLAIVQETGCAASYGADDSGCDRSDKILLELARALDATHAATGCSSSALPVVARHFEARAPFSVCEPLVGRCGFAFGVIAPLVGHIAGLEGGRRARELLEQTESLLPPLLLLGLCSRGIVPRSNSVAALALLCEAEPDAVAGAILAAGIAHSPTPAGAPANNGLRRDQPAVLAAHSGPDSVGGSWLASTVGSSAEMALLALIRLAEPRSNHRCALRALTCLEVLLPRLLPHAEPAAEVVCTAALIALLNCVPPDSLCASARCAAALSLRALAPFGTDAAVAVAADRSAFEQLTLALAHKPCARGVDPLDVAALSAAAEACAILCVRRAGARAVAQAGGAPALLSVLGRLSPDWVPAHAPVARAVAALARHVEGADALMHAGVSAAIDMWCHHDRGRRAEAAEARRALELVRAELSGRTDGAWHEINDGLG